MTEYISNADFRRQKTALTRAINSKVPVQVLATVEKTLGQWAGKAWPDDWARWARALDDAFFAYRRHDDTDPVILARFHDASGRF